jgi:hypothetical protein
MKPEMRKVFGVNKTLFRSNFVYFGCGANVAAEKGWINIVVVCFPLSIFLPAGA